MLQTRQSGPAPPPRDGVGSGSAILHQEMALYNAVGAINTGRYSDPVSADQVVRTQAPPPRPWVLCEIRSQSFKRRPAPLSLDGAVAYRMVRRGSQISAHEGGDWEVLTVECQGPRPRAEDPPDEQSQPCTRGLQD